MGRHEEGAVASSLEHGLSRLHLAGFNLLVEPDFERVRRLAGPDPDALGRE